MGAKLFTRLFIVGSLFFSFLLSAQSVEIKKFYDNERKLLKEAYFVKSLSNKVLHGGYRSYYINGNIKSKGTYNNNLPDGKWEYYYENKKLKSEGNLEKNVMQGHWRYYFENGNINMEGLMQDGQRVGEWKFYYESGGLKMEGPLVGDSKEGHWKYYYEDGKIKAEAIFHNNKGFYKEYYSTGKIKMEGKIANGKSDSLWRYYHENGNLQAVGMEEDGLKTGHWKFYHENQQPLSEGNYQNGVPNGNWKYYHPNGVLSAEGEEKEGQREGYWKLYYENSALKGEGNYTKGSGEYKEYYESGKLKASGYIVEGKNNGEWVYFYENGKLEANVSFDMGEGKYTGFYENGKLKMEGLVKDNKKVGVWKLYDPNGELAGYYKTFYDNAISQFERIPDGTAPKDSVVVYEKPDIKLRKRKSRNFSAKHNEFTSFIIGSNPTATIFGNIPVSFEYYIQERLGFEFIYAYVRDPFFTADKNVDLNNIYDRGYFTAIRMKLYKPDENLGMFYFANELRFTSEKHFANIIDSTSLVSAIPTSINSKESRVEYSFIMGNRFMKYANKPGFTLDVFLGLGVGYRFYNEKFPEDKAYKYVFRNVNKNALSVPLRLGFTVGYAF